MPDAVHVPESDVPIPRPPQPSGIPKTLGILSIVFGGLTSLGSLFGIAGGAALRSLPALPMPPAPANGPPFPTELIQASLEASRRLVPYQQTEAGVMLLMSLVLLFIGIGLLKYR